MKRLALALFATAGLAAVSPVRADPHVRIGVGIGGPVFRSPPPPVVVVPAAPSCPPPAVVVTSPYGYWKEVPMRTWVPERWVVRPSRWGRPERVCIPGYYAHTTQRVWVETRSPSHPGHGHGHGRVPDRGYAYGPRR